MRIDGHFAPLPMTITHNGSPLCGSDPLPCSGSRSRQQAIASIYNLAHTLHVQPKYTKHTLSAAPCTTDWETVPLLRYRVQALADALSHVACTRVADKGPTMLFNFCCSWVWDHTHEFLT